MLLNLKQYVQVSFIQPVMESQHPVKNITFSVYTRRVYTHTHNKNTMLSDVVSYTSFSMSKRKVTFQDGDGEITLEEVVPKKKVGLI